LAVWWCPSPTNPGGPGTKGTSDGTFHGRPHHRGRVSVKRRRGRHQADLERQDAHGVNYVRYWVDEAAGKIFCLVEAPDAEAAATRAPRGPWPRGRRDLRRHRRRLRAACRGSGETPGNRAAAPCVAHTHRPHQRHHAVAGETAGQQGAPRWTR
jgi:hypothetical protein